jgi:hypothetical protein
MDIDKFGDYLDFSELLLDINLKVLSIEINQTRKKNILNKILFDL